MDTLPSKILENVVNELSKLPGIGKRTALRFALHLLKQPIKETETLALWDLRLRLTYRALRGS